jgi:flagellar hook assembly protein FlgD
MAFALGSDGSEVIRYGKVTSPGVLTLNGPVVQTTFALADGLAQGTYFFNPQDVDLPALDLWTNSDGSPLNAWVQAGSYNLTYRKSSWTGGKNYLLSQPVTLSGPSATITTNLSDTAEIRWAPQAGRTYDSANLRIYDPNSDYYHSISQKTAGDSVVVKRGTYEVGLGISVTDPAGDSWSYSLEGEPVTVTAQGLDVREGALDSLVMTAPTSVMPGSNWNTSYDFMTDTDLRLSYVYKNTSAPLGAKDRILVGTQVPGRAPTEWAVGRGKELVTDVIRAADTLTVYPELTVTNAAGKQVNSGSDTRRYSTSTTWEVPARTPEGAYTAKVVHNAGPIGQVQKQVPLTVGKSTVTEGVRLKVTDAAGNPLRGVEVDLLQKVRYVDQTQGYAALGEGRGVTDAEGYAWLHASYLKAGTAAKVLVTYEPTEDDVRYIIRDVTVPMDNLVISLAELRPVTLTSLTAAGQAMNNARIGAAYVDDAGIVIARFSSTLETNASGQVTFHLSPGKVKFTAIDFTNHTFTVSETQAISATTKTVSVPVVGPLKKLTLSHSVQAADGSDMVPVLAYAAMGDLPGVVPLGFDGGWFDDWRVTPGVYSHFGEYARPDGMLTWGYELTGAVDVTSDATVKAGGPITAAISAPDRYGSTLFRFPTAFQDAHGNYLVGMESYDPNFHDSDDAVFTGAAVRQAALDPRVEELREAVRLQKLPPDLAAEYGAEAYPVEIAPFLRIKNAKGDEVFRSKETGNWRSAYFYPPSNLTGMLTAEISVGVGPEGTISDSVAFGMGASLSVSPKLYNPSNSAKLTIGVSISDGKTYTLEIRNAQHTTVKSLGTVSSNASKTWDGKDSAGKIAPNGEYEAVLKDALKNVVASAEFTLKMPVKAVVPTAKVAKALVNTSAVTVTGVTTPGFTVTAQVKAPGATGFGPGPSAQAGTDGAYSLSISLAESDGAYQIQVKSVDPEDTANYSAWSTAVSVTRDMTAPPITLTSPTLSGNTLLVRTDSVTLKGTTEAAAKVTAVVSGSKPTTKTVTASSKGAFAISSLALGAGTNTITLQATDPAGNTATPQTFSVVVDKVAPELVKVDGAPQIKLTVTRGQTQVQLTPDVDQKSGAMTFALSGSDVTKFVLSATATESLGSVILTPAKKWNAPVVTGSSFDVELLPSANGTTTYGITLGDLAGNSKKLPSVHIKLDSTAPTLTINDPDSPALATIADGKATVVLVGTGSEELRTVSVVNTANPTVPLDAKVETDGKKFAATVTLPLAEATYSLQVRGEDLAGNQSTAHAKQLDTIQVHVDVTAPAQPTITSPTPTDTGLLVNSKSLKLAGTAEPGSLVVAQVGSAAPVKPVTASKDGAFSLTLTVPTTGATVKVWAADKAGNQSEAVTLPVAYDATAPAAKSMIFVVDGLEKEMAGSSKGWTGSAASANSYALKGTFSEAIDKVLLNDKPSAAEVTGDSFTLDLTGLKNGSNSLKLKVYDFAGNTVSVTVALTLDSQAPVMTVSESNLVTNQSTATFTVSSKEALQEVQVVSGNEESIDDLDFEIAPVPKSTTKWTVKVTLPTDTQKTWSLRFKGVDLAGNVSTEGPTKVNVRTLTFDPDAPVLVLDQEGLVYTKASSIMVTGSVSDTGSGLKSLTVDGSKVTPMNGKFSKSVSLTDGKVKAIVVVATDNAGNVARYTFDAVRKSTVKKPAISSATVTSGKVTISGTADVPVVLPDETVLAVDLQMVIKNAKKEVVTTVEPTLGANGKYTLVVDLAGWAKGTYTIELATTLPQEYTDLELTVPALSTKTFTIK